LIAERTDFDLELSVLAQDVLMWTELFLGCDEYAVLGVFT
jgi:hypothetical protein